MSEPIVELREVRKSYGRYTALDGINLDIRHGEFLTLLGQSGCGKTTTLRLIAGFEQPDQGTLKINGKEMGQTPSYQRSVNTVFQNYALFPHMSVLENVAFGLRFDGVGRAERRRRALESLEIVGLADKATNLPANLSGGQQQRAALARALIKQPLVLLLDEPLSALDAGLRKSLQVELKTLQRQTGITFVFVTHDQDEAMTMSDRIVVMDKGQIQQCGTPQEVYERPASRFVAEFVGPSNKLDARLLARQGSRLRIAIAGAEDLLVTPKEMPDAKIGDTLRLVLRPGTLSLPGDVANKHPNAFPARVLDRTYTGDGWRVMVALKDGQTIEIDLGNQTCPDIDKQVSVALCNWPIHCFAKANTP